MNATNAEFFEVHYWPTTGRILVLNKRADQNEPTIAQLIVQTNAILEDTTFITALALCEAGRPAGEMFEHTRDGKILAVNLAGFQRTTLHA